MRALIPLILCLLLVPAIALAGEGDPLLSVDDLHKLAPSYEKFLSELGKMIVEHDLLTVEELPAWHDAQMGDFYQNGGYGSILASYMPGMLSYVREEDTLLSLSALLHCGTLEISTVRRYTPQDSSLSGLMLTLSLTGADGLPLDVTWMLSATGGLFFKWDPVMGSYESVGVTAQSGGETLCWSDQTPAQDAQSPVITIDIMDNLSGDPLGQAILTLTVDGDGYLVEDDALIGS